MLVSLTEKEIAQVKHALDIAIEQYEDKSYVEEYDRNFEAAAYWEQEAYYCRKILEKL